MAKIIAADEPFVRREVPARTRWPRIAGARRRSTRSRSSRICHLMRSPRSTTPVGLDRPLPRAARPLHQADRRVQAALGGGRVLARRREAPDAPAHLRHRLGDARASWTHYLERLEERARRDHRRLGRELGLFTFSDLVGPGLPLWLPKGAAIRRELKRYVTDLELRPWLPARHHA